MVISCNHAPVHQVVPILTKFSCNSLQLMYSTGGIFFSNYIFDPKCNLGVTMYIQYEFSTSSVQEKKKNKQTPSKGIFWEEEFYFTSFNSILI